MIELDQEKNSKPVAFTFHGFLGEPSDFDPLNSSFNLFALDLRPGFPDNKGIESKKEIEKRILKKILVVLESEVVKDLSTIYVFSYSMGSKYLVDILKQFKNITDEIGLEIIWVSISTHFGVYRDKDDLEGEEKSRDKMNQKYLEILANNNDQFLDEWNSIPLFNDDRLDSTSWTAEQIQLYFREINKSQLKDLSGPEFLRNFKKIYVVYGELDEKYCNQAILLKKISALGKQQDPVELVEFAGRSHRILRKSELKLITEKVLRN